MQAKEQRFRVTVMQGIRRQTLPRLLSGEEVLARTCLGRPLGLVVDVETVDVPAHEFLGCRDIWGVFCGICGRSKH